MEESYYLGTIQFFPYTFTPSPQYWVPCNGAALSIQAYSALYSLIGAKFGGDGTTNFCVPNLQAAANGNIRYYILAQGGEYPPRQ